MDHFIENTIPSALNKLHLETKPEWGEMNAEEMLDHLSGSIALTFYDGEVKILTPEDKLPGAKAFILSDKPIPMGAQKPSEYHSVKVSDADFKSKKEDLISTLKNYAVKMQNSPDFSATHPYFGELRGMEWVHFQKKHFRHHLAQFGLMERDAKL